MSEELKDEVFEYLDELKESGETNMFGATQYIVDEFGVSVSKAQDLLKEWIQSLSPHQ